MQSNFNKTGFHECLTLIEQLDDNKSEIRVEEEASDIAGFIWTSWAISLTL